MDAIAGYDQSVTAEEPQSPNNDGDIPGTGEIDNEIAKIKAERKSRKRPARTLSACLHRDALAYEDAERYQVVFQIFSLVELLGTKLSPPAVDDSAWSVWDDITPRAAHDRDGIPILYHFPNFIMETFTAQYSNSCLNAGRKLALTFGSARGDTGADTKESFVFSGGEIAGCVDFARAVVHEDTDQTPFTSASLCNGFTPLTAFMTETEFLSQRVNNLINSVDPTFHEGLERLRNAIKHIPNVRAFADIDPILMEGRYLNFNQSTSLHATPGDFEAGWNVLISLGSFTEGGYVRIPRLGLRVRFLPGDVLVLRGVFLEHEVEVWSGGQRICLEHYTQGDLWKYANIEL